MATKRSSSGRKSGGRKYGKAASKRVASAMRRRKRGTLKGGKGSHPKVKSRKQAIAIGLSEAREKGAKVPSRRTSKSGRKSTARKSSSSRKSTARKSSSRKSSSTRKRSARSR